MVRSARRARPVVASLARQLLANVCLPEAAVGAIWQPTKLLPHAGEAVGMAVDGARGGGCLQGTCTLCCTDVVDVVDLGVVLCLLSFTNSNVTAVAKSTNLCALVFGLGRVPGRRTLF